MNSHYQLTPENEFRYILNWFRDFSEYEKADFMAILIQWLLKNSEICVNGISDESSMASVDPANCRPLSIFLCRVSGLTNTLLWRSRYSCSRLNVNISFDSQVKLFKEWTPKWPDQLRSRLIDKLNEIDSEFGLKLNQELEEALKVEEEPPVVLNGIDVIHNGVAMLAVTED